MSRIQERVFVDSSMFKAIIDEEDDFYEQAKKIWDELLSSKISLITANYIIDETFTLVRIKCGLEKAVKLHDLLAENIMGLAVIRVSVEDDAAAWGWFLNKWSKLSFTDCTSFAVMKRLGLTRVATFDDHFQKAGFKVEK